MLLFVGKSIASSLPETSDIHLIGGKSIASSLPELISSNMLKVRYVPGNS